MSRHVMSCHLASSRVASCHVVSCLAVSRRVVLCLAASCRVMLVKSAAAALPTNAPLRFKFTRLALTHHISTDTHTQTIHFHTTHSALTTHALCCPTPTAYCFVPTFSSCSDVELSVLRTYYASKVQLNSLSAGLDRKDNSRGPDHRRQTDQSKAELRLAPMKYNSEVGANPYVEEREPQNRNP